MPKQQSQNAADHCPETDVLCVVTAGVVRVGSGVKFTRARGKGAWVTARGIDSHHRWLFCTDNRGLARTIRLSEIYWVGNPPPRQKQRDVVTTKRRRGRR